MTLVLMRHLISLDTDSAFAHVAHAVFSYLSGKTRRGGVTQPRWRWRERGKPLAHTRSHAQMHSGNTASVTIHPREKHTHSPSDSDEEGAGETPD